MIKNKKYPVFLTQWFMKLGTYNKDRLEFSFLFSNSYSCKWLSLVFSRVLYCFMQCIISVFIDLLDDCLNLCTLCPKLPTMTDIYTVNCFRIKAS